MRALRWVGSARRGLLNHVIVFDEQHLRRLLHDYVSYYNAERVHTHLSDAPAGRPAAIWEIVHSPLIPSS